MKIKSVEFARKFNLGNFETQDIKILADVEENEDVDTVINDLKMTVEKNRQKL